MKRLTIITQTVTKVARNRPEFDFQFDFQAKDVAGESLTCAADAPDLFSGQLLISP